MPIVERLSSYQQVNVNRTLLNWALAAHSKRLGNPEHGAVVAVRIERNIGPVPFHGISRIGGEAPVLQGSVEDVDRDAELPVGSRLQEKRVRVGMSPNQGRYARRDGETAPESM